MRRLALVLTVAACHAGPGARSAASDADRALATAIASARAARTAKDACAGLRELSSQLDGLQRLAPPQGQEQPFAERRNGLIMRMDVLEHHTCADPGATPDMIADDLDALRARLAELEGMAAGH